MGASAARLVGFARQFSCVIGFVFGDGVAEELSDHHFAEAFDVHHGARGEVAQLLFQAGRATGVDAAVIDLALFADEEGVAARAVGGEDDLLGAARVLCVFDHGDDFGDDVAAALDLHEVADADAEAGDLVGVVQRGAGDGGAADEDRRERGDRRHLAGAADLEEHAFELRNAGARGEFVGDGPARRFAGEAEAALLRGGVHLDDDAVDLVAERVAQALCFCDEVRAPRRWSRRWSHAC